MKGFTIIETLVAIAIFALALGVMTNFIVMAYRIHNFGWQQSVAIDEARKGIETMVKEIREARLGDDGSYPIEYAGDKEFIFYSDIDKDDETERVRYFLGTAGSGSQTQQCVSFDDGGSCNVVFSNFFSGDLISAEVKVSVEGDFGMSREYAEIYADGIYLGRICQSGCSPDCAGDWQGTQTFDITEQAQDNFIEFIADATYKVNDFCDWEETNHSMKARFEFSWKENLHGSEHEFKKGITNPTGVPIQYPSGQEQVSILSSYVRNVPPIFTYFDAYGNELIELPARLKDTKVMQVYLVVNVNPNRSPQDFELKSSVYLRNLKND